MDKSIKQLAHLLVSFNTKRLIQEMIELAKEPRALGSPCTKHNGFILVEYGSRFAGFL